MEGISVLMKRDGDSDGSREKFRPPPKLMPGSPYDIAPH